MEGSKNPKVDGVVRIPASLKGSFFRFWFEFLAPIHNLTEREQDVAAAIMKHRYEYSKVVKDDTLLDKITLSEDTRKKIREECNLTASHFQVIMSRLRKAKIIEGESINKRYIPQLSEEPTDFKLLLYFELNA